MTKENKTQEVQALYLIKRTGVEYNQYWSELKQKFGPLLEATYYTTTEVVLPENSEIVDFKTAIMINK